MNPVDEFRRWFEEAREAGVEVPEAMTLATADAEGRPSARLVLLKGADERGFTFFTGYESRKGRELEANPRAALVFYWQALGRQVRVEGAVDAVSAQESDAYFATRPRGSRLAAWASEQSRPLDGREQLALRYAEVERQYEGQDVPRPPHWGGYRLHPEAIEFWRHRDKYPRVRNTLAAFTGLALLVQLISVAPPRLLPQLGFIDIGERYGQSVYAGANFSAQALLAMPSVHIGWAVTVAGAVLYAGRGRLRYVVLLHPLITLYVVTATEAELGRTLGVLAPASAGRSTVSSSKSSSVSTAACARLPALAGPCPSSSALRCRAALPGGRARLWSAPRSGATGSGLAWKP